MVKYGLLKSNAVYGYSVQAKECVIFPLRNHENKIAFLYDYIGDSRYSDRKLQELGHEDGRIRAVYADNTPMQYAFDYFEKDQLQNIRVVLTDQTQSSSYLATMEAQSAAVETQLFSNVDETRTAVPVGYPTESTTAANQYVAKLSAKEGGKKSALL